MRTPLQLLALLALSSTSQLAWAITYAGNPTLHVTLDDTQGYVTSSSVELMGVRVYRCSGQGYTDYPVGDLVDLTGAGWSIRIDEGDLCGARLYWDTTLSMYGTDPYSNPLELAYDEPYTDIYFAEPVPDVPLTQFTVVTGVHSGPAPYLKTSVIEDD
jgi:hypothetical protein